eukprot:TRINITY_DN48079_c0_g1_i2.p1 TRINITY_DN48079_c0_g1~~TRINITY_DN48079_c0_g1_i2.p1  ORF type:complete len:238 (+),score=28.56 TRINITY_DN48079_c0_g1_i2:43-756(+)
MCSVLQKCTNKDCVNCYLFPWKQHDKERQQIEWDQSMAFMDFGGRMRKLKFNWFWETYGKALLFSHMQNFFAKGGQCWHTEKVTVDESGSSCMATCRNTKVSCTLCGRTLRETYIERNGYNEDDNSRDWEHVYDTAWVKLKHDYLTEERALSEKKCNLAIWIMNERSEGKMPVLTEEERLELANGTKSPKKKVKQRKKKKKAVPEATSTEGASSVGTLPPLPCAGPRQPQLSSLTPR